MRLLDWLLPDSCAACREDLPPRGAPVCARCREAAARLAPPAVALRPSGRLRLVRAAFPYAGPLPPALHAFKYDCRERVGAELAAWFAARWPLFPELGAPHALVPVPLHPRKRRRRGLDQAARLAAAAAWAAGVPALSLLERVRDDPPQAGLPGACRAGRLKGAFRARGGTRLNGARLVLIDDVATSGETLRSCARALTAAGAADVRAYALAYGGAT